MYQGDQGSSELLVVALLVPQVLQQGRTVVSLLPCKAQGISWTAEPVLIDCGSEQPVDDVRTDLTQVCISGWVVPLSQQCPKGSRAGKCLVRA